MGKFIIVPGCSDLNRGDQALAWETKKIMEDAGYIGEYYLTAEKNEPVEQSRSQGLRIITPILEHPSRKYKKNKNIQYTFGLKLRWGIIALGDFIFSLFILIPAFRHTLMPFLSLEKQESIKTFETADAIFLKGGGLLQTSGGFVSTYSMYFWTYPLRFAIKLGKPVFVLPNSFGPFKGPFVKRIAQRILSQCQVVTTRETYSQKMVKTDLNLDCPNFPDLAFSLAKSDLTRSDIFERFGIAGERKLVAITMRPYRFPRAENPELAYKKYVQEMGIFIRWLYENGYLPLLVVHTLAVNEHEDDFACLSEVMKMLDPEEYRLISDKNFDCKDLKAVYAMCDYTIGTRFHSVIFSLASGVPSIAIAYVGNKAQGIMHDMSLDSYVIDISKVTANELIKKFIELVDNTIDVKQKIAVYNASVKMLRTDLIDLLKK
ncbi:polysaccharide pyruvyl transferase family protein [Bifidobacterium sp. ESL0775]|uniref:polysaccharide pyruvyl transferase family protein n=1 Tax=Bifidobacterium sp. ESL0775 TaxID=2983230 RepID=UPI0023F8E050|nr:polysaccharide pyruvyl transferase family protein [Bifidobacterium sp. ESL0775]WEV69113.1 polysaccharide pyruvyl transferase family protein [Bifidobacterium sp. ESL0775]